MVPTARRLTLKLRESQLLASLKAQVSRSKEHTQKTVNSLRQDKAGGLDQGERESLGKIQGHACPSQQEQGPRGMNVLHRNVRLVADTLLLGQNTSASWLSGAKVHLCWESQRLSSLVGWFRSS